MPVIFAPPDLNDLVPVIPVSLPASMTATVLVTSITAETEVWRTVVAMEGGNVEGNDILGNVEGNDISENEGLVVFDFSVGAGFVTGVEFVTGAGLVV